MAVEMAVEGEGRDRNVAFRTNVDDLVEVGAEHPLRFEADQTGALKPYLLVRGGLWARLTRALTYDLIELGEDRSEGGESAEFGIFVRGTFYPVPCGAGA
jgi:hypothetical protein